MRAETFKSEAEECRRQATAFSGKPESDFLLRLAGMFEELACEPPSASETLQGKGALAS